MKNRPSHPPQRDAGKGEALPSASDAEVEAPGLPALIRQRDAFAHDVTRIETALADGADGSTGLYERLLRCRRISGKLENQIEVARLQQKVRTGS